MIPLRPDEVPNELVCSICLSVPLDPVVVPKCSHVFCEDCITESIYRQESSDRAGTCPVCRCDCSTDDLNFLEDESPLSYRIWSSISVKCEHHTAGCSWTGSLSDYERHKCSCRKARKQRARDRDTIQSLKEENEEMKSVIQALLARQKELERRHRRQNPTTVEKELENLRTIVLKNTQEALPNEEGEYVYDRWSVLELSKLICQNLMTKPSFINSDKIFDCVKNISHDLNRGYKDNPKDLNIDVRMLLGICMASTWFTEKQQVRILEMAASNGWAGCR